MLKLSARLADALLVANPFRRLKGVWRDGVQLNLDRDLRRASNLRVRGRYEDSRALLQRILTRHPGKPHAMWQLDQLRFAAEFDLADALHGEGRTNEAEALLEGVVDRAPDQVEPRLRLAPMLVVRGACDEAADQASVAAQMAWDDRVGRDLLLSGQHG